jgi:hypothetical protein
MGYATVAGTVAARGGRVALAIVLSIAVVTDSALLPLSSSPSLGCGGAGKLE